jgi:hypothetical protein
MDVPVRTRRRKRNINAMNVFSGEKNPFPGKETI